MTENNFSDDASEQNEEAMLSEEMGAEGDPNASASATDLIDEELAHLIEDAANTSKEQELLADLKRLQAEFINYKNRVERDRDLARNAAIAEVLRAVLPALDDLERAESHGDLEGTPFAAVVTKLRAAGEKFGLAPFGKVGDKFDPEIHNALVQTPNPEVKETVIADVVELGFHLGDRLLRPALVAVFIAEEK